MTAGIGSYIKALREAKNYSGRKLGMLTKVSNATISRIEDDSIMPSPDTLRKLAGSLSVSYTDLMSKAGYLDDGAAGSGVGSGAGMGSGSGAGVGSGAGMGSGSGAGVAIGSGSRSGRASAAVSGSTAGSTAGSTVVRERETDIACKTGISSPRDIADPKDLAHIKDEELKKWMLKPDSADYLILAKKISDLGIDPKFVDNVFISKIFKPAK